MKKSPLVLFTFLCMSSFAQTAVSARMDNIVKGPYSFSIFQSNKGSDVVSLPKDPSSEE